MCIIQAMAIVSVSKFFRCTAATITVCLHILYFVQNALFHNRPTLIATFEQDRYYATEYRDYLKKTRHQFGNSGSGTSSFTVIVCKLARHGKIYKLLSKQTIKCTLCPLEVSTFCKIRQEIKKATCYNIKTCTEPISPWQFIYSN